MPDNVVQFLSKKKRVVKLYFNHGFNLLLLCLIRLRCLFQQRQLIVVSLYEHIGDIVVSEPIIRYLRENNKSANIVFATSNSYKELQEMNPSINYILGFHFFSEWIMLKRFIRKVMKDVQICDLHLNNKRCSKFKRTLTRRDNSLNTENIYADNRNLLQIFCKIGELQALNESPVFYLDKRKTFDCPASPYIVFHTQTNAAFKDWQPHLWTKLYNDLASQGYTIVEIGLDKQVTASESSYIDYTGKKSLQSIASLVANCTLFVGLDSGFAHMANALGVNGVVLMGQFIQSGKMVFKKYNPFPGLYSSARFIVNTEDGDVSSLSYDVVYKKVIGALQKSNAEVVIGEEVSYAG